MTKSTSDSTTEYITPGEASRIAFVTPRTMTRLAKRGTVRTLALPSGHRRYLRADVEALLNPVGPEPHAQETA